MEMSIWEPLVTASRRRRKEISCGARPGEDGELGRMEVIWMERPVRVERTRRVVMEDWVVKRRGLRDSSAMVV